MPDKLITIEVDREAFLVKVREYVDISPAKKEIGDVLALSWPSSLIPPALFQTVGRVMEAVEAVISAVEVVKAQFMEEVQTPEGSVVKFSSAQACEAAVDVLDELIVLEGWIGRILDRIDKPILNLIVSILVNKKSRNWLDEAKRILGLIL